MLFIDSMKKLGEILELINFLNYDFKEIKLGIK